MAQHFHMNESAGMFRRQRPGVRGDDLGLSGSPSRLILGGGAVITVLGAFFLLATMHAVSLLDSKAVETERTRATLAVQAMTRDGIELDADKVIQLGHDFMLQSTRLAEPGVLTADEIAVPLPDSDLMLAWMPHRVATETLAIVAPYRIAAAGLLLAGVMLVLHRLYKLARNLDTRRQAARDLAGRDPLTGLLNRRGFAEALEQSFATENDVALLYLDLDDFKSVNDSYGHATGDRLLECVAQRLLNAAGPNDAVARLGGDEFVILRRAGCTPDELSDFAKLIHTRTAGSYGLGNVDVRVGLSIGVAWRSAKVRTPSELVANADAALYRAKAIESAPYALAELDETDEAEMRAA